jgi:HlyD family secretion protein
MSEMDRPLERRRGPSKGSILLFAACGLLVVTIYLLVTRAGTSRLRVDPARMTAARVETGEFREYYPFDGRVEPVTTVYLDIEEGGRVEKVFVEGGQPIEKGQRILRFSNATLQRTSIDTETRLVENLNALRNTQFSRAQSALLLKDQLLDLDYRVAETQSKHERYSKMIESGSSSISQEVFEQTRDELEYLRSKRDLLAQRIEQEDVLSSQQLAQANQSIERLNLSLDLLTRVVDSLDVRAPISGFLSSIDAEVGQNINRGQRIGQIDRLDKFKIQLSVDEFYISRVDIGTMGKFDLNGRTYDVAAEKIYPEVSNGAFRVDVAIAGAPPPELRRGQSLTVEMNFSEPTTELMVAKGGFYQRTGGRWVYLVSDDRRSARRTPIRLGRQNPRYVEVLEGLRPGDWIISSGYDAFNEVDELRFTQPIELLDPGGRLADAG